LPYPPDVFRKQVPVRNLTVSVNPGFASGIGLVQIACLADAARALRAASNAPSWRRNASMTWDGLLNAADRPLFSLRRSGGNLPATFKNNKTGHYGGMNVQNQEIAHG
jgi:hypothetical protein